MLGASSTTNTARVLRLCGLAVVALAVVAACQKDPAVAPAPASAPQVKVKPKQPPKTGPSAAELTAGMVEASGQGKAQGPVNLKFELPQKPKVGQPLEINLALLPQIDATTATIQVTGADGFTLAPGDAQFEIPAITAGEVYRHTLNLTPTAEGVWLIGVTLQLKTDDNTETRAFSIPVIVDR